MRPASRSCIAGPSPRYGTCVTSMPTARLSNAQARCDPVPGARRAVLHLALIGFRVSDEIRQIAARDTAAGDQNERLDRHQGHRREVGRGIVERLLVDQRALRVGRLAAEQECVAVGIGPRDARGAGHAAGTGHVFDDHRLVQDFGEPCRINSPKRVVDPARRKRHHHGHRPGRPILRLACVPAASNKVATTKNALHCMSCSRKFP